MGSNVTTVAYDVENRVTQITYPSAAVNTFAYNGEDLRTQKVDSSGTRNYVCDGSSPASAVLKDGSAVYTPGLSERRGSTSKFTHADALGSTRGITDSSQSVTDAMLYDAFGNTLSRTGTTPTPFGFVGKSQYQTDADSGLQLLGHRYYDPSIGRFLSQDPIQAGTNWYAYCDNNPLTDIDPEGLIGKIKHDSETYFPHIGDVDKMKGWPHWDGRGKKWIDRNGRVHDPRGGKPTTDVNKSTKKDIFKQVKKLFEDGFGPNIIPPAEAFIGEIGGGISTIGSGIIGIGGGIIGTGGGQSGGGQSGGGQSGGGQLGGLPSASGTQIGLGRPGY